MKTKSKCGCYANIFPLRSHSSRWRKHSQCKIYTTTLLCSIKVHRQRRESMIKQSQSDISQLIANGRISETLPKAELIYEDEQRLLAYDQIEFFCKLILRDFSSLKQESDINLLPDEIKEAIAGLIFAASRIGELTELSNLRSLFGQRFGLEFDKDCVELRQGNLVNSQMKKILERNIPQDGNIPQEDPKILMENC